MIWERPMPKLTIYTAPAGRRTSSSKTRAWQKRPRSRLTKIRRLGMGMESKSSLSFASYSLDWVVNTLPITPMAVAIMPIRAKYSQSSPMLTKGAHSAPALAKKRKPKQASTYSIRKA